MAFVPPLTNTALRTRSTCTKRRGAFVHAPRPGSPRSGAADGVGSGVPLRIERIGNRGAGVVRVIADRGFDMVEPTSVGWCSVGRSHKSRRSMHVNDIFQTPIGAADLRGPGGMSRAQRRSRIRHLRPRPRRPRASRCPPTQHRSDHCPTGVGTYIRTNTA